MQAIVPYLEQLRTLARGVDPEDPERVVRLAFDAAGVPSSTYYRAYYGADLRSDTADKVGRALQRITLGDGTDHDGALAEGATASAN